VKFFLDGTKRQYPLCFKNIVVELFANCGAVFDGILQGGNRVRVGLTFGIGWITAFFHSGGTQEQVSEMLNCRASMLSRPGRGLVGTMLEVGPIPPQLA